MKKIVLLRHGQSIWNKDNRFTGWTDVDLTERGTAEAREAGRLIKEAGFDFDEPDQQVLGPPDFRSHFYGQPSLSGMTSFCRTTGQAANHGRDEFVKRKYR